MVKSSNAEDKAIIQKVLGGDVEDYALLVKKYQKPIFFLSLRMLRNTENADEVTQKAFMKAYRALEGFQFQSSFKTWLSAIALNLCRTELMKKKRYMEELPLHLPDSTMEKREEHEEKTYQRHYLQKAVDELPLRQKEVVSLRIYEEMPFKEIAEVLESTESAVKVNFHHAMKSLKEWIQERKEV